MYTFHILTRQAANGDQNYKQKKYTFHNFQILVRQSVIECKIRSRVSQKSGHLTKF